jgi:outer membrane receptor protein involved in Fe transport
VGVAHGQQDDALLEEVTVTGSRIRTSGMVTPTPVTVLSGEELGDMSPRTLVEALGQLPQFYGNTNPDLPGLLLSSPGAGNLDLRGLGNNRTLTLLNGRRIVATGRQGSTDINVINRALLDRVEVVTGGASAAYGADAVAGVVNFILDTEFTGFAGDVQSGISSRSDNGNYAASLSFGTPIRDRMHLVLSADVYGQDGIAGFDGRRNDGWGLVTNPEFVATGQGPRLLTAPYVVGTRNTFGGLILQPGSDLHRLMFRSDGTATPFIDSDLAAIGHGTHSQSTLNGGSGDDLGQDPSVRPITTDFDRHSLFANFEFDASDNLTFHVQVLSGTNTVAGPAASARMFDAFQATIYQDNAFLPEELREIMIAEGLESFGFSRSGTAADVGTHRVKSQNDMLAGNVGFDAEVGRWRLDGYYQHGTNERRVDQQGWTRTDRLFMALDAVRDPATGAIVCRATLVEPDGPYRDCVPIDLFGSGRASPEALRYVTGQDIKYQTITTPLFISQGLTDIDAGFDHGRTATLTLGPEKTAWTDMTQQFAEFTANRDFFEDRAAGPILVAMGGSWRKEEIFQVVGDISNPSSDPRIVVAPADDPARGIQGVPLGYVVRPTGFQFSNLPNIAGSYDVSEVFAETLVPLLSDRPFVERLDLSLAARRADYSGSGGTSAWKIGADWQVGDQVRFRVTRSRDVRAGTLEERFDRVGAGASVEDPELNFLTYLSSSTSGGNPEIQPEEADTSTLGVVYQPSWADGLAIAGDWYDIEIHGVIGQLSVQRIVDDCFDGALALCAQITRDPATNLVTNVANTFLNLHQARVRGTDLEITYSKQLSLFGGGDESVNLRLLGSWLHENSVTNLGVPKVDRAGQTGLGTPLPEDRFVASMRYDNGPWGLYLQQRVVGSGTRDATHIEGVDIDNNRVSGARYTDLNLSHTYDNASGSWEFFLNVTNLFDEKPPIVASFSEVAGTGFQTNAALFDILGRRYVAGMRVRF